MVNPNEGKVESDAIVEDAAELLFPKEFEVASSDTLMTSEVFLLLDHRRQQNEKKEEIEELNPVFLKTLEYTRRLARFKNREAIRAVRVLFGQKADIMHKFEIAQLANLLPETAEEAKSLIPSLQNKIEDDALEEFLKEVTHKKTFQ
uniref:RPOL4c domain-containing protein n=1 Tax=Parastrongyloides trichosuri TaxID=131310 RepID=A0A0N4ZU40_PARTI